MPIQTTYPDQHTGFGRTYLDNGLYLETHQGYAQIPTAPTAAIPIFDLASPNPLAPVALTIVSAATSQRSILSITGVVVSAESNITLSAAGTIRVATTIAGLTADGTQGATTAQCAVPRSSAGALISGTTIPRGSVLVNGGSPIIGFAASSVAGVNVTYNLYGSNNDTTTSTTLNMSSSVPTRPAFVLVTIRSLVRAHRVQQVTDYPELPRAVRELLQITV